MASPIGRKEVQLGTVPKVSTWQDQGPQDFGQRMAAAAELYKFPPRPWLPGGALARAASRSRAARGAASAYLGRRQEVGPETGSGRLEGEHGAAACAPRPCGRPDACRLNVPGAAAQAGSAARPAGRTDGRGPKRRSARPMWAGPGGATPISGSGPPSRSQSSQPL